MPQADRFLGASDEELEAEAREANSLSSDLQEAETFVDLFTHPAWPLLEAHLQNKIDELSRQVIDARLTPEEVMETARIQGRAQELRELLKLPQLKRGQRDSLKHQLSAAQRND